MRKILIIPALILMSLSCESLRSTDGEGSRLMEMVHDGVTRSCLVHVPKKRTAALQPLLIVLHGRGGTGKGIMQLTKQRFNELSDTAGFYVAYPYGLKKRWNDFPYASHGRAVDDVGFISALISRLASEYPIDKGRIFVAGLSNGGYMAYRLACSVPAIRGIAAVTATHWASQDWKCAPSRPVSVMIINGTEDPIVPYHGGEVTLFGRRMGRVVSTDETLQHWVRFNRCRGSGEEVAMPDADPDDKTLVRKTSYSTCDRGTRVVLFRVEGGGHAWPGGLHYLVTGLIGHTSRDINACDEIWNFFSSVR